MTGRKGTDCTPEQLQAARTFIEARGSRELRDDSAQVVLKVGDVVLLLAWYGAMRFKAGRDGTGGSLERPGILDTVKAIKAGQP